ncbi:MAG: hypothetical protein NWR47_06140 [Aestuariivirgaceae bacterium]|nr:hypothetical protein [Aestuariivirgaceae bacterium]
MNRRSAMALLGLTTIFPWALANPASAATRLRMIVGMDAGGGTDQNARLVARYLERHLGGTISIENDARAGGVTALQAALTAAKLVVSTLETTNVYGSAIEDQYPLDITDVALLDNFVIATRVVAVRTATGVSSVQDWRDSGKTLRFGTRTPTYYKAVEMKLLSKLWGVNLEIVPGYSTNEAKAAFAAGEIDLVSGSYTSTLAATKGGGAAMLVRTTDAAGEDEESTLLPDASAFIVNDELANLLPIVNQTNKLQMAFVTSKRAFADAGPLSAAFSATKQDPEYQAAAAKAGLVVDLRGSDEIRREFTDMVANFGKIRAQLRQLL